MLAAICGSSAETQKSFLNGKGSDNLCKGDLAPSQFPLKSNQQRF
jgi:hypothetical protein